MYSFSRNSSSVIFASISGEGSVRLGVQYSQGGCLLIMQVVGNSCLALQLRGADFNGVVSIYNTLRCGNISKTCCSLSPIAPLKSGIACLRRKTSAVCLQLPVISFRCAQYSGFCIKKFNSFLTDTARFECWVGLGQVAGIQSILYDFRRFQLKHFAELAEIFVFSAKILPRLPATSSFAFASRHAWIPHMKNITGLYRL